MPEAFDKKIREVRLRCSINLLLEMTGITLIGIGVVGAAAVIAEKLLAVEVVDRWISLGVFAVSMLFVLVIWVLKFPGKMQAALLIDERAKLKEHFSTALYMENSDDPFALASQSQARKMAVGVRVRPYFPIQLSKRWIYAVGAWIIVSTMLLFLPQQDLLGFLENERQQEQRQIQIEQVRKEIQEAATPVRLAVKKLGDEELQAELEKFDLPEGDLPEDVRRQAISKLGDLSDKIKQLQVQTKMGSVETIRQMLKQLKGTRQALSRKLGMELAKGNFSKAADLLRQYQKQIAEGKLSREQKKMLKRQLADLAGQLGELARKNYELEKELEKAGLDKKLAKLGEKQLREALKKQGLNNEQIERLMQKTAACRSASNQCGQLGAAMASAGAAMGGMNADDLSSVLEQLDVMDAISQQMQISQAALDEIKRSLQCLGQSNCQGGNCGKPGCGNCGGKGDRMGAGRGYGFRPTAKNAETSTKNTKIKNSDSSGGPIVASWYFKGRQVKGQARRGFSEVIQAGRDSAAEAISENQIPRKYQESVKKYFGGLEESN